MRKNKFGIDDLLPLLATAPTDGRSRVRSEKRIEKAFEQGSVAKARRMLIEAIRLDPGHTKATAILIDDWPIENQIQVTRELLRIEREALGAETFEENEGHFWGLAETRPFMRRLNTLFDLLRRVGDTEAAIACGEESLRLCPHDNVGARGPLLGLYLGEKNNEAAESLLDAYPDDASGSMTWGRVLFLYACDRKDEAEQAIENAMMFSPRVAAALIHETTDHQFVADLDGYTMGSFEEAMIVISELESASAAHPEFSAWLRERLLPDYVPDAEWERKILSFQFPEDGPIPYDALREALKLGTAAVPTLMAMLEHTIRLERILPSDPAPWSANFILLLLGEIGSPRLIEAIHRLYCCYPEFANPFGDYTTEELPPSLVNALNAAAKEGSLDEALSHLETFLADESCEVAARWSVAAALREAVLKGHAPPEKVKDIARRWFEQAPAVPSSALRYKMCDLCVSFGWESFRPEVERAFEEGWICIMAEDKEEMLARFGQGTIYKIPEIDTIKSIQRSVKIEAEQRLKREQHRTNWRESARKPAAKAGPKTGRNEICPCGSGKKFKKCCL